MCMELNCNYDEMIIELNVDVNINIENYLYVKTNLCRQMRKTVAYFMILKRKNTGLHVN